MKNYIFTLQGGGPFSRILQCGIIPLSKIDFDNVYLKLTPFPETTEGDVYLQGAIDFMNQHKAKMKEYGIDDAYDNILNYVLDQNIDPTYIDLGELPIGKYYTKDEKIEESEFLNDYKFSLEKIRIKNHLKNHVHKFCKINKITSKTLAVHVRMTTMVLHTQLPHEVDVKWESYYNAIDNLLDTGNYDNIFVASDNDESLNLLDKKYTGMIHYYPNMLRFPKIYLENYDDWNWDYNQFFMKQWWEESFIETLTLANCGTLICRESNLANMAVVFSNSIKNVVRVYDY